MVRSLLLTLLLGSAMLVKQAAAQQPCTNFMQLIPRRGDRRGVLHSAGRVHEHHELNEPACHGSAMFGGGLRGRVHPVLGRLPGDGAHDGLRRGRTRRVLHQLPRDGQRQLWRRLHGPEPAVSLERSDRCVLFFSATSTSIDRQLCSHPVPQQRQLLHSCVECDGVPV